MSGMEDYRSLEFFLCSMNSLLAFCSIYALTYRLASKGIPPNHMKAMDYMGAVCTVLTILMSVMEYLKIVKNIEVKGLSYVALVLAGIVLVTSLIEFALQNRPTPTRSSPPSSSSPKPPSSSSPTTSAKARARVKRKNVVESDGTISSPPILKTEEIDKWLSDTYKMRKMAVLLLMFIILLWLLVIIMVRRVVAVGKC